MELAANPFPGFEIELAYTYINAEVIEDNELPVGTPLLECAREKPKHLDEVHPLGRFR